MLSFLCSREPGDATDAFDAGGTAAHHHRILKSALWARAGRPLQVRGAGSRGAVGAAAG